MYGIEKGFDIDLAVLRKGVGINLYEAAGQLLGVEALGVQAGAVVEEELRSDLLDLSVQKHILLVKYHNGVDDVLQIPHLVGRDYYSRFLSSVFEQH